MKLIINIVLIFAVSWSALACDQVINKAGAKYLKSNLKDVCGEEDKPCIAAVENQFDPCHKKYENEWNAYMDSNSSTEDALLKVYSENLYACIIDADGEPYFEYSS